MAKAGSNLKFLRSGLTISAHVTVAGEVIPIPKAFTVLSEVEQKRMYGKVFYVLTDEPVNTGPTAKAAFVRIPEPPAASRTMPEQIVIPKKSESERGGGGGQAQIPTNALPAPDDKTVPGHEDKKTFRELEKERRENMRSLRASPEEKDEEKEPKKSKTITLTRLPNKKKKKLVEAKPTRMKKKAS